MSPEACSQGGLESAPGDSDLGGLRGLPAAGTDRPRGARTEWREHRGRKKYPAPFSNVSMKKCPLSHLWKAPLGAHVGDPHNPFLLSLWTTFFVMVGKSQEGNPMLTVADGVGRWVGVSQGKRGDEGLRRPPDLLSRRIWQASGAPRPSFPQGQKPDMHRPRTWPCLLLSLPLPPMLLHG